MNRTKGGRRQWFLRPLWRDPSFIFCFVFALFAYALMLPSLWRYATNGLYVFFIVAYFFLVWFIVCALISIPIGMIRGFWQGQAESDQRERDPEQKRTTAQSAIRVSGRMAGRFTAGKKANDDTRE